MKKILFFTLLMTFSLAVSGQGLTPRIYANGTDTVFAFNRMQIKSVTKLIVKGQFDAQTIRKQDQLIADQDKKLQAGSLLIRNLYAEIAINTEKIAQRDTALTLANEVITGKNKQLDQLDIQLGKSQRQVRRTRRWGGVLIIIALLLGTQL